MRNSKVQMAGPPVYDVPNENTVIANILLKFVQRWRLFVLVLAVLSVGAFVYLKVVKPVYSVKASLIIENDASTSSDNTALKEINVSKIPKRSETEVELLKSRKLIRKVVAASQKSSLSDTTNAINYYTNNLEAILVDKNGPLIQLSIKDADPEAGKDFLNRLMIAYIAEHQVKKDSLTQSTLNFINQRLFSLSKELDHSERDIEGYKSGLGFTDVPSESAIYLQDAQTNGLNLNKVDMQLKVINTLEEYINKDGNAAPPSTIGIDDAGLISLIGQLSTLQLEKNKMLATTPESNYIFQSINSQISSTKASIKANVQSIKASLLAMRESILAVKNQVRTSIKSLPGQERGYISIKRQQAIKENLYTYLLQKREQVGLSYASIIPDASVVDNAYVASVVWPKPAFVFALVLFLALFMTATYIFLEHLFNGKVMQADEIQNMVSVPVISQLSYINTDNPTVVIEKPRTAIAEEFRRLRTNLHHLHGTTKTGRVTLITSSISGEGKSFVTANLGVLLAGAGRKTIILDLDLHRPKLYKIFSLKESHGGIGDYLTGDKSFDKIVQPLVNVTNLSVVSNGPNTQHPSELIESKSLDVLIDELRADYDDIIIDSPPLNIVNDALILSRLADVSLYVVRKNVTKKSELVAIDQLQREQRLPNMNIVFNCVHQSNDQVIY
jgi:tyrosine-protein kinase Etk/Wzc